METGVWSGADRRSLVQLFLVSFLSLFIELIFIRWMSADIRAFSIFKTFPLVSCFIGLGVGCAQKNDRWFGWAPALILASMILMRCVLSISGLHELLPANTASYNWYESLSLNIESWLPVTLKFMAFLVIALSLPFFTMACIGSRIGTLFNRNTPLLSYAADLLGALLGTIVSSTVLLSSLDPSILLSGAAIVLLFPVLAAGVRPLLPLVSTIAVLILAFTPMKLPWATFSFWSPYQHLSMEIESDNQSQSGPQHMLFRLSVNGKAYQSCWDHALERNPFCGDFLRAYWSRCFMPYRLLPNSGDVAIVAAGMGMDVQAAVEGAAKSITAVDIDPMIIRLGKSLNPCHPYQSEKVLSICDDARHFFISTAKKYDLVVFSHLDSQTVLGQSSSVRLDNFVYTKESFQRALKILKSNGLLFVCFNAKKDWFRDRIYWTLSEAAGYPPLIFKDPEDKYNWSFFAVSGPLVRDKKLKLPPDLQDLTPKIAGRQNVRILTDDWPYLYVQAMSVDWTYILISLEIMLIAFIAGRRFLFNRSSAGRWQLFFLGSGFLLLELQSISRLSLLYGTTWSTSAVVIAGVLIMILCANMLVLNFRNFFSGRLTALYGFLAVSLFASYMLPVDALLSSANPALGIALATVVTLLPMFAAGLIFPVSFSMHKDSATAFAFNLCGSTLGALLEYQSNFTGINSLVVFSFFLYLISFFLLRLSSSQQD